MRFELRGPGTLGLLLALAACGGGGPVWDCEPVGAARPLCGYQNPEDLAILPDGHTVVVSEYGAMEGGVPGRLSLLDLRTEIRTLAYEGGGAGAPTAGWGDPRCPGPPPASFSPHGIDLARRPDGAQQLLVVQHGGRESVEIFEALPGDGRWHLEWRGCAIAPPDSWLNEVVALPGGGFLATNMMSRSQGMAALTEGIAGSMPATGWVYEWGPRVGFRRLEGSEAALPNGIALSPDGESIYLNVSGGGEVWRMTRGGEIVQRVAVPATDNSTWAADGRLLVASLRGGESGEFETCGELEPGTPCALPFEIVAIDWTDGSTEVLYRGGPPPMGAGTVGLQVGDDLLIGSFAGDRILRVDLAAHRIE